MVYLFKKLRIIQAFFLLIFLPQSNLLAQVAAKYAPAKIERLNPALDAIIDTNSKLEIIAEG
ncbi:MAG: hypothetical protein ABIP28_07590, partial [Mucilaginibacter sp.]